MLSKRKCPNISRAPTNLKAVPQDVTRYSCCVCLVIIVITTVRVQVLRNIDIFWHYQKLWNMLSKRKCLNISRAPTNLKAVPQEVTNIQLRRSTMVHAMRYTRMERRAARAVHLDNFGKFKRIGHACSCTTVHCSPFWSIVSEKRGEKGEEACKGAYWVHVRQVLNAFLFGMTRGKV